MYRTFPSEPFSHLTLIIDDVTDHGSWINIRQFPLPLTYNFLGQSNDDGFYLK